MMLRRCAARARRCAAQAPAARRTLVAVGMSSVGGCAPPAPRTGVVCQGRCASTAPHTSTPMAPANGPVPTGMDAMYVGVSHVEQTLVEVRRLDAKRVFVMANRSSAPKATGLLAALKGAGVLAADLCTAVGMGAAEEGLLQACDAAAAAQADCVVTMGGGAIQDAGKIVRMFLSTTSLDAPKPAVFPEIQAACKRDPMPKLAPQIALANSFAMAEVTCVAGMSTAKKEKSGIWHPAIMPTVVIFDPVLAAGLPDWVRYGTALRGVEHVVGAVCHPHANEEVRALALEGAGYLVRGINGIIEDPESAEAMEAVFVGSWHACVALQRGGYPTIGHLTENHYSARFDVHQGSCSGVLMARILAHHASVSGPHQARVAEVFGRPGVPLPQVIRDLVARLPGVQKDHAPGLDARIKDFATYLFDNHAARLNKLSPVPFASADDVYNMLTRPLTEL